MVLFMDEVVNRASSITGAHNWSAVRDQHPREVDAMAHGLDIGDPLADSVITEMFASGDLAWPDIVAMLDRPDTSRALPPALSAFLTSAKTTPAWYQPTLAAAGAQAWWRFGSLQSSTLYQSLIYGYQAAVSHARSSRLVG